jgi:hypothetical protein
MGDFHVEPPLTNWRELQNYQELGWIFRGHREVGWPLATSLQRFFARNGVPSITNRRIDIERELIRDFKRAYHQYGSHVPSNDTLLEWISLMQHHGAPTRFCDFTYSIYVALYFAMEAAEKVDCAIWAINDSWANEQSRILLERAGREKVKELTKRTNRELEVIAYEALFKRPPVACAYPLNAFQLNQRLRVQKGVFLCPGDPTKDLEENIKSLPGWQSRDNVRKIKVPVSWRTQVLRDLFYMNISRTSLFPGLDGYAQSLGAYHPALEPWEGDTLPEDIDVLP